MNSVLIFLCSLRYVQLIREKEERRRKVRQEKLARLSEKEVKIRDLEERRQVMVERRQLEVSTGNRGGIY